MTPLSELRAAVASASAAVAGREHGAPAPALERPKREGHGDYATNAAMLLAPVLGAPPREIAERVGTQLADELGTRLERFEVAGPGFVNLFLADDWYRAALDHMLAADERFGAGEPERRRRILIEFVSANPTGPLVAASGRHAAYGDALARILAFAGHEVAREYYFNDAGSQIRLLGESIQARARDEEVPEGGYEGDYVRELAEQVPDAATRPVEEVARAGVELMFERIRRTLERYGVEFDQYFNERELHEGSPSAIEAAYAELEQGGHTYRRDGALWLRTSAFGDERDRVLERSSGEPTYFAADVAYIQHKRGRGYDLQLDVFGADHHGHVASMKAAMAALGADPDELEVVLMQFVHLVEGGERAAMSKRRGVFATLDELIDDIGVDATRFFMLRQSHETTLDLDLDLAREQSSENPVYYVQYAHARIASLLGRAGAERVQAALAEGTGGDQPLEEAERALVKNLLAFPDEVREAAERRAPHRIAGYALELAQQFTDFYRDCRVVGAEPQAVESFRLALSVAAKRTIARALELLGVGAPEEM